MSRYFFKLAYRGTAYHGWQIQENALTIQEIINKKLGLLVHDTLNVTGCGRTDAGVHAREFYFHVDLNQTLPYSLPDLIFRLNRFLPADIAVYNGWKVPSGTHARFDAISRTYRYYIALQKNPFFNDFSLPLPGKLQPEAMRESSKYLLGKQDFTSFSKLHTDTKTNICTVTEAFWEQKEGLLIFTITADRFLRNMVRAVVGTLLEVGQEKISPETVKEIILAKDRHAAGYSVPAKGLFLEKVRYPDSLQKIFKT